MRTYSLQDVATAVVGAEKKNNSTISLPLEEKNSTNATNLQL